MSTALSGVVILARGLAPGRVRCEPIRVGRLHMVAQLGGPLAMFGCHLLLAEPAGA